MKRLLAVGVFALTLQPFGLQAAGNRAGAGAGAPGQGAAAAGVSVVPAGLGLSLTPGGALGVVSAPQLGVNPQAAPAAAAGTAVGEAVSGPAAAAVALPGGVSVSAALPSASGVGSSASAVPERRPAASSKEQAAPLSFGPASSQGERQGAQADGGQAGAGAELSAEGAKAAEDGKFDGKSDGGASSFVQKPAARGLLGSVLNRLALSPVRRVLPQSVIGRWTAPPAPKVATVFDRDEFGGPQTLKLPFKERILYGARWGLSLVGISTLLQLALTALGALLPWQLYAPRDFLNGIGRVELMTGLGPVGITKALAEHPIQFLLFQLPMATAWEEFVYRGLHFGLMFMAFAAVKPAAAALSSLFDKVPDVFDFRSLGQGILKFAGRISANAFLAAAALSTIDFVAAHFAAWGIAPMTIAIHGALGFALSYIAYKTWSLSAAIAAHLTYNLLSVAAALLSLHSMILGTGYSLLLGAVSVAALYMHWRSYRKAKGAALAQARVLKLGVPLMALLAVIVMADGNAPTLINQRMLTRAAVAAPERVWNVEDKKDKITAETPQKALEALMKALLGKAEKKGPLSTLAAITAKAKPAVVEVRTSEGLGSGFVVSPEGLIISNAHVVDGALRRTVLITFPDGSRGPGKVVAVNTDKDIALIQLPPRQGGWPSLTIGDSGQLSEGDEVLAMGHPLGLPFTVTRGIISGLGSRGSAYVQHVQTDAAINHGNSGGPLLNMSGEIVGMNTQIASTGPDGGSIGLGFAITSAELKDAVAQYRATGNINSSWLGVILDMTNPLAPENGVEIEQVRPGSPAAKAGLAPGDVIVGVNGHFFSGGKRQSTQMLSAIIARIKPGEVIKVAIGREGDVEFKSVTLSDKLSTGDRPKAPGGKRRAAPEPKPDLH